MLEEHLERGGHDLSSNAAMEHWGMHDHVAFMAQAGAMPPRTTAVGAE